MDTGERVKAFGSEQAVAELGEAGRASGLVEREVGVEPRAGVVQVKPVSGRYILRTRMGRPLPPMTSPMSPSACAYAEFIMALSPGRRRQPSPPSLIPANEACGLTLSTSWISWAESSGMKSPQRHGYSTYVLLHLERNV